MCAVYEAPEPAARFMVFSGVVFPRFSASTPACIKDWCGILLQFDNRRDTPWRTCITVLHYVSQKQIFNLFVMCQGLITLTFWMCSLDVRQTICSNNLCFSCAAKYVAYYNRFSKSCVLGVQFDCTLKSHTENAHWKSSQRSAACSTVCSAVSLQQTVCCTSKLHLQNACVIKPLSS
jgi:hypothetical protein